MNKLEFNLEIVLEGLKVICASPEERISHFAKQDSAVDDNFDFIVLDYLSGAVEAGLIPKETASGIEGLFKEADGVLSILNWQQEDKLLAVKPTLVEQWQAKATMYIEQINAHNQVLNRTP